MRFDMDQKSDSSASVCPACGRRFGCDVEAGLKKCWCMDMPAGLALPEAGARCYCPECLAHKRGEASFQSR